MFLETPSSLHRSRTFRPSARQCSIASLCLISGAKLGNHCKVMPVYALLCAAIPDFRGYTWESLQGYARLRPLACSDSGFQGGNLGIAARLLSVYALLRAAIPDFRGSIWESLQGYARLRPLVCSDSGFQGVNLGIAARLLSVYASCVQRFFI